VPSSSGNVGSVDPRTVRLSPHFLLSDFLGCYSVYMRGYANPFIWDNDAEMKLENARALCNEALEPLMAELGPLSIGYGYISPDLSRRIVGYQDPNKASHHRWDLGAAADVCFHGCVTEGVHGTCDLYFPEAVRTAPVACAHCIDYFDIPYSRLITYSESPYLCLAVSAREVVGDRPRKAFYENRYMGAKGGKPLYRTLSTPSARRTHLEQLQTVGLEHDWRGAGYPTYHSHRIEQYHHMRVSKYTMVSDWLFDLTSISNGVRNVPSLNNAHVLDAFAAAGTVYDWLIDHMGVPRASIVQGYVSHVNPQCNVRVGTDWRQPVIGFTLQLPDAAMYSFGDPDGVTTHDHGDDGFFVEIDVETVLRWNQ
jgi:hypothetical protein